MLAILTLLFILSGAAGLFYESVWSRYLGLFLGHGAYAQVIVLVIFLGGMALGAGSRGGDRHGLREPLMAYALVEAERRRPGAVLFHHIYRRRHRLGLCDSVFPALGGRCHRSRWRNGVSRRC